VFAHGLTGAARAAAGIGGAAAAVVGGTLGTLDGREPGNAHASTLTGPEVGH
jgi:hypothetical protein